MIKIPRGSNRYHVNTLVFPLPQKVNIALSGGSDSMGALAFLLKNKVEIENIIYCNHNNTGYANRAQAFVIYIAKTLGIKFNLFHVEGSSESEWRDQRLDVYQSFDEPIVLAHHLDDCIESYVMNALYKSAIGTIPYSINNCIRPFRTFRKSKLASIRHNAGMFFCEDPTNKDTDYCARNYVRGEILQSRFQPNLEHLVLGLMSYEDAKCPRIHRRSNCALQEAQ